MVATLLKKINSHSSFITHIALNPSLKKACQINRTNVQIEPVLQENLSEDEYLVGPT